MDYKCKICGYVPSFDLFNGEFYCLDHYKDALLLGLKKLYRNWNANEPPSMKFKSLARRVIDKNHFNFSREIHLPYKLITDTAYKFEKISDYKFSFILKQNSKNLLKTIQEKWIVDISNKKVTGSSNYEEKKNEYERNKEEIENLKTEMYKKQMNFIESFDFSEYPIYDLAEQFSETSIYITSQWFKYYDKKEKKVITICSDFFTYTSLGSGEESTEEWEQKHELINYNLNRFIRVNPTDHDTWHERFRFWLSNNDLFDKYVGSIGKTLGSLQDKKRSEWYNKQNEYARYDAKKFIVEIHDKISYNYFD